VSPSASLERSVERRLEICDDVFVTRLEYQELMAAVSRAAAAAWKLAWCWRREWQRRSCASSECCGGKAVCV
jgi:hypothetical protein